MNETGNIAQAAEGKVDNRVGGTDAYFDPDWARNEREIRAR